MSGRHPIAYTIASLACFVCLAALAWASPAAYAVPIYKCRAPDGALSYRDSPCPEGSDEQPAPKIEPPPAYVPPVPEMPDKRPPPNPAVADFDAAPPPPPPLLYRCYDGETGKGYVSDTPRQNLRYVPLWTVLPGDAFANVGGPQPKGSPPSKVGGTGFTAGMYGQYTAVEDRCREMQLPEMCAYWYEHIDDVSKRKRLAFKDTRGGLEQEEAGLRDLLRTYCAR